MWTELFLENRENLAQEIDNIIARLREYGDALKAQDAPALKRFEGGQRAQGGGGPAMRKVSVPVGAGYDILIGAGLLGQAGKLF